MDKIKHVIFNTGVPLHVNVSAFTSSSSAHVPENVFLPYTSVQYASFLKPLLKPLILM
jgi:hypothetical protein